MQTEEQYEHDNRSISELDKLLDTERHQNNKSSWSKLDKSTKLHKLKFFCDEYDSPDNTKEQLYKTLMKALDQNKLQKIKDVVYDTEKEKITSIPSLVMNERRIFAIKSDKRLSTSRSLPKSGTKKKKIKIDNKD